MMRVVVGCVLVLHLSPSSHDRSHALISVSIQVICRSMTSSFFSISSASFGQTCFCKSVCALAGTQGMTARAIIAFMHANSLHSLSIPILTLTHTHSRTHSLTHTGHHHYDHRWCRGRLVLDPTLRPVSHWQSSPLLQQTSVHGMCVR